MGIRPFGIAKDKSVLQESQEAREIVNKVMEYGISQKQIYYIIHDLALNLENREDMIKIAKITKEMMDGAVLIVDDDSSLIGV